MAEHILKCPQCKQYTLSEHCPRCGVQTAQPLPPKFSPEDKYGRFRREVRKEELVQKGWY